MPLSEIEPGATIRFERLTEELELDGAALRYLDDAGFIPGATATAQTKAPDGTILIQVGSETAALALGRDLCRQLFVVEV